MDAIPGVVHNIAGVLLAEMGIDLSLIPTDKHLASWAGMWPGTMKVLANGKADGPIKAVVSCVRRLLKRPQHIAFLFFRSLQVFLNWLDPFVGHVPEVPRLISTADVKSPTGVRTAKA